MTAIAGGGYHTCAVVDGGAQCWGGYAFADGTGNNFGSATPAAVSGLTGGVSAITAGKNHSCAIVNGGAVCWGNDFYGQLGDTGTTTQNHPVAVSGLASGVTMIAGSRWGNHTCAIASGLPLCWGENDFGQLGDNDTTNSSVPRAVSGVTAADAITAGEFHSCAITNGHVVCWGNNADGELGDGSTTNRPTPVAVLGL